MDSTVKAESEKYLQEAHKGRPIPILATGQHQCVKEERPKIEALSWKMNYYYCFY